MRIKTFVYMSDGQIFESIPEIPLEISDLNAEEQLSNVSIIIIDFLNTHKFFPVRIEKNKSIILRDEHIASIEVELVENSQNNG